MPNVSRNKGKQGMEFGKLVKYKVRNISFKNHAENEAERLVPDLFLLFIKALYNVQASG